MVGWAVFSPCCRTGAQKTEILRGPIFKLGFVLLGLLNDIKNRGKILEWLA